MVITINHNHSLYTPHFADTQVEMAQDKEDLEYMTRKLIEEYYEWGLELNRERRVIHSWVVDLDLTLDNNVTIESCKEYKYHKQRKIREGN